jgi:uncharacterized protein
MSPHPDDSYSAFAGVRLIASGPLAHVALAGAKAEGEGVDNVLVFSDSTGEQVDLNLRGSPEAIAARYRGAGEVAARGRGRPRLGVIAREVTLLPDQWAWLASQPGGASVALRKLVQEARRSGTARDRMRRAQERSYKVMVALAGNLPGFEEAARALFANDQDALRDKMKRWPQDVRDHVLRIADPDLDGVRTA